MRAFYYLFLYFFNNLLSIIHIHKCGGGEIWGLAPKPLISAAYAHDAWASCSHLCDSATKQYNLVSAKRR